MKLKIYRRPGSPKYQMECWVKGKRHRASTKSADERKANKIARDWARNLEERHSVTRVEIMLSMAIDGFVAHCKESGLARTTVANYASRLGKFLDGVGDVDLSEWVPDVAYGVVSRYLRERAHEIRSPKHDRLVLSAFFNYLRYRRWYKGENPADAKLHSLRQPRAKLRRSKRRTTREEDLIMRRLGPKHAFWPVLLLTRWAGMRRGEACSLLWSEISLDEGYADVVGHEGGRKHPRRVGLAPWVVLQLRTLQPNWLPENGKWPVWPRHPDTATEELQAFCDEHLGRRISYNDLRATFTTECFERGLTPKQESMIVGHSAGVADRHYSDYEAMEARTKLAPDPLTEAGGSDPTGVESAARVAQK